MASYLPDFNIEENFVAVKDFIYNMVDDLMKDQQSRQAIVAAVGLAVTSIFRLNPVGMVATTIVPMLVAQALATYDKQSTTKEISHD